MREVPLLGPGSSSHTGIRDERGTFGLFGGSRSERALASRTLESLGLDLASAKSQIDVGVLFLAPDDNISNRVSAARAWTGRRQLIVVGPDQAAIALLATRAGATDYLPAPLVGEALAASVDRATKSAEQQGFIRKQDLLVGSSQVLQRVLAAIQESAHNHFPVLVVGESGTGKEIVARAIHGTGHRRTGPFVAVNCGAISESIAEAELFGSRRGSYTGALRDRPGYFVEADDGTIFLDEVGNMSLPTQAKLLRVLEVGEVMPVGASRPLTVNVRIIAATNGELEILVRDGRFRADLYWRLAHLTLRTPPLRDHLDDIPEIAVHHLARLAASVGRSVPTITQGALDLLRLHDWPGNVRELIGVLSRAFVSSRDDIIDIEQLGQLGASRASSRQPDATASDAVLPWREARRQFEVHYVRGILERAGGNISQAAKLAGKERKDFYEMCHRCGLDPARFRR